MLCPDVGNIQLNVKESVLYSPAVVTVQLSVKEVADDTPIFIPVKPAAAVSVPASPTLTL